MSNRSELMEDEYLSVEDFLLEQAEETKEIIKELLADGSDAEAEYAIEHHLFAEEFATLEKVAVEAFRLGFEISEAEEVEDEDGTKLFCFDAVMDCALDADIINEQTKKLVELAEKFDIIYDGWGTYYEGEDAIDYDNDNEGEEIEE